jgi:hypothetical protein
MASTINSLPDGIVFSADSSGALNIQVNGNNAIQIGASQSVTVSNLAVTSITLSGVLPINQGGTGRSTTPTNGQLLIGNGSGYSLSTLTAGSGISITNNSGSITITNSSTGGAQDYIVQSYGIV